MIENRFYKDIKVLIVEDDLPSRIYITKSLQNYVPYIKYAENGQLGLDKFQEEGFDIVISDIGMPVMNGLTMSKLIKDINPKVQIILATAFDNKEFLFEAIKLGINDFLSKPVDRDLLFAALDKATHLIYLERQSEEAKLLILKQNELLESRVNERTQELIEINSKLISEIDQRKQIEQELIHSKEIAESANKAKSSFLAKVSHELRTPLNGILGLSSILLNSITEKKSLDFIKMIKTSGDGLLSIINDILDYTKIESGKMKISNHDFELNLLISDIIKFYSFIAAEKSLILNYNLDPRIPKIIHSDSGRLKQVLTNLIGNSIKFTEKGSITINIILNENNHNLSEDKIELLISVKDTGIGIPLDQKNNLFQSFTQVDNSLTRKHGGTGLGLAISKELVELMNGKIWFESTENIGTTFYFTIQIQTTDYNFLKIENTNQSNKYFDYLKSLPLKILIADDSFINLNVLKALFDSPFWRVVDTTNGFDAIELAKSGNFDIFFLDINMPEIDGYEITTILNQYFSNKSRKLPIIGLTGDVSITTKNKCISCGMYKVLEKPISQDLLFNSLEENISDRIEIFNKKGYFDLTNLKNITNTKNKMFIDIIDFLINHAHQEIAILEMLINANKFEDIRKTAHRMKSEYSNIGALNTYRYLDLIENNAKNNSNLIFDTIFPLLKSDIEIIITNLIEKRKNMGIL